MILLCVCKFMFSEYFCISTFVFVFELLFAHCVFVHRALGKYPSFRLPVKQRGTTSVKQRNQQPPLFKPTISLYCNIANALNQI